MTALAEKLKPQLTALSSDDRAELARYLLASLDGPADPGSEQAWETELARRAAEVRTGRAEGRPAAEAFAELRQRHS
jgi:putative addiction module component (TIGR02574 family)